VGEKCGEERKTVFILIGEKLSEEREMFYL
jgi:hypothetical protein